MSQHAYQFELEPCDNRRLAALCGPHHAHIKQIEETIGVKINHRSQAFSIEGKKRAVESATQVIQSLYQLTGDQPNITRDQVHLRLLEQKMETLEKKPRTENHIIFKGKEGAIRPRGPRQAAYVKAIQEHSINFGIGPAGTGKTFLGVACAVAALEAGEVNRILLVRPVVEAGESLGFLPGDFAQKIDPYLRPLFDALNDLLGPERVARLIEKQVIEIAPLAYMRGRTLSNSFILLDEAQNCTKEQMKMFLTRIGLGSRTVITGDLTQIDLPRHKTSGLRRALEVLDQVEGISFSYFLTDDVTRHPLVEAVVQAYEKFEEKIEKK